jgi:hypothetical protein
MTEHDESWPSLPTETEIYILPSGEIVVADLPAELAALLTQVARPSQEFPIEEIEVPHVADQ